VIKQNKIIIKPYPAMRYLLIILLTGSLQCFGQSTIPDYLGAPFPTGLTASKDGKTIAWIFNEKGSRNLYAAKAPEFIPKRLTEFTGDDGMDISAPVFTSDGSIILFVRGNGTNSSGEPANPSQLQSSTDRVIWRVNNDGSHLQQISKGTNPSPSPDNKLLAFISGGQVWLSSLTDTSKAQKLFSARGGESSIRWSPDGKTIAFVSNRNDHSFIGIYSFATKTVTYPDPNVDHATAPIWSTDGKRLAWISVPNINHALPFTPYRSGNPWSVRMLDLSTGLTTEVWKADEGKGSIFFDEYPSGDNLLLWTSNNQFIIPYEKDGWQHLYSLDPSTKKLRLLTPGEGEIENAAMTSDGQSIYYTTNISDINRRHIWKLNIADGKKEQLTTGKGIEWSPVITSNGLAFLHSSFNKPAWPAIFENGKTHDIGLDLFPKNYPTGLVEPTAVVITAKDGIRFTADLFLPNHHNKNEKHPAIIFFHGGSHRQMVLGFHYSQYYSNAYALNEYYASKGYIVLSVNYRSGIGYGMEFREALRYGASGASEVNDVMAAGKFLRGRSDVDPKKIALWGGSYGGYLTAFGLARASDLFACGVDMHGVHNWNTEIPIFDSWYDYAKFPEMAKKALESSPISYVKGWRSPVLFIHGDDDRNVYFSETVNLAEILKMQHVHVEQLIFPDEVHSFLLHRNWVKAYEANFDFVERQFGRKAAGGD
jgi:dipeptidyl aminopeptidase/acylaminoacyl peptidase